MLKGIIYKATNIKTNKIYIGQTKSKLEARIGSHLRSSKKGKSAFQKALRKYGKEGITWEIIDNASDVYSLNNKEIYWISYYNSIVPNGYNICTGGNNKEVTEEFRKRVSDGVRKAYENTEYYEKVKYANSHRENYESYKKGKTDKELFGEEKAKDLSNRISESLKEYFKDSNNKDKLSNITTEYFKDSNNRLKTSIATKKAMQRPEVKEKLALRDSGSASRGKILINNSIVNKRVLKEELDTYLNNGWTKGFKRKEVPINV
jgi:hypothetical protein